MPNLLAYDPAFGYELAVIIREGMRRMYTAQEDVFYYLTVTNQNYPMPSMPEGEDVPEGILRGLYRFRPTAHPQATLRAQLFGSGAIMNEVLEAQRLLAARYEVAADVWSVTSYKNCDAMGWKSSAGTCCIRRSPARAVCDPVSCRCPRRLCGSV